MNKPLNIISVITVIGFLWWLQTDFDGGMVIYGLMYPWIILPLVIVYLLTLIVTIIRVIQRRTALFRISIIFHSIGLLMALSLILYRSELFKSKILLSATLVDDLNTITIELRQNQTFDTSIYGMFGYTERISGEYHINLDTIIFHQAPYSNDFIPNKIIIDHDNGALYFNTLEDGDFDRTKSFVNYFEIRKNKIKTAHNNGEHAGPL